MSDLTLQNILLKLTDFSCPQNKNLIFVWCEKYSSSVVKPNQPPTHTDIKLKWLLP